jgi:hypothetical protein
MSDSLLSAEAILTPALPIPMTVTSVWGENWRDILQALGPVSNGLIIH